MRRSVTTSVIFAVLSVSLLVGCGGGGGKYAEVKKLQAEMAVAMEAYAADLEKATTSQDVAAAMNGYADKTEAIMPQMRKLAEKYPELDTAAIPEELQESQELILKANEKMSAAYMKVMPLMDHPDVTKAQQRMMTIAMGEE